MSIARALLLLGLVLLAGCTERDALPTRPAAVAEPEAWPRIYPVVNGQDLYAVWGLDADDMWAVGDGGAILHWDGRQVRSFATGFDGNLRAIAGHARDSVWAVAEDGTILSWNGRLWQVAAQLDGALLTVFCAADDEFLVGGYVGNDPSSEPAIWRYDGRSWNRQALPAVNLGSEVRKIWRPGPGRSPVAATDRALMVQEDGRWQRTTGLNYFFSADRDLVLDLTWEPNEWLADLYRLRPDGSLTRVCDRDQLGHARQVVASRQVLLSYGRWIRQLDGCQPFGVHESFAYPRALATPELAGPRGAHVFVAGDNSSFSRLTWLDSGAMAGVNLVCEHENRRPVAIGGHGRELVFRDSSSRLYRQRDGAWVPVARPFSSNWSLQTAADGTLAIRRWDDLACLVPDAGDDQWHVFPRLPVSIAASLWVDASQHARLLTQHAQESIFWTCDDDEWVPRYEFAELYATDLVGFAPDDLFMRAGGKLWHFDGSAMHELLPELDLNLVGLAAGPHTGRLYLEHHGGAEPGFSGYLAQGVIVEVGPPAWWDKLVEVDADHVYGLATGQLLRLGAAGWTAVPLPTDHEIRDLWGHPQRGLFVLDQQGQIFHHDPSGSSP
jgi:hypothetical protein